MVTEMLTGMVTTRASDAQRELLTCFADLLVYPNQVPLLAARRCVELAADILPEAVPLMERFGDMVEGTDLGRIQELYTEAFDLEATWHPYVGYHLLGETYQRSQFLVGLKERYRACGFHCPEGELPDHVSVVLRFLAECEDADLAGELASDALEPMLAKMTDPKKSRDEKREASPSDGAQSDEYPCMPTAACAGAALGVPELTGDDDAQYDAVPSTTDLSTHPYKALLEGLRLLIENFSNSRQP